MTVDNDRVALALREFRMMRKLINDDDPPKSLQRHPLVDVAERGKMVAQHGQDEGVEEGLWQRGHCECVRFLLACWDRVW